MRGKENRHHGNYSDYHLHSRDRVFVGAPVNVAGL